MSTVRAAEAPHSADAVEQSERDLVDALVPRQRSRRWGATIAVAAAGLVAVVTFGTTSGTVVPRLSVTPDNWGAGVRGETPHFTFTLHNDGMRPATITAVNLGAAGLDHGRLDVRLPIRLAPHQNVSLTATFTGLHCDRIDPGQYKAGVRITARGDFPFARTVTARIDNHFAKPFEGMRTYSGADPLQIGWPAGITQDACAPA
jgi:hypothetical protein